MSTSKSILILYRILFLLCSLNLWTLAANSQSSHFESITTSNGLSNGAVYDILKDSKGFIWFCTDNGINRFDGAHFKLFTPINNDNTSLSYHKTRKIIEDNQGRLWVATHEGLNSFDRTTEKFTRYFCDEAKDTTFNSHIINIIRDSFDNLWVLSLNDIYVLPAKLILKSTILESDFIKVQQKNKERNPFLIQTIFESSDRKIWAVTSDGKICQIDLSRENPFFNPIKIEPNTKELTVLKIVEDKKGSFWLLSQSDGIIKWNRKIGTWEHFTKDSKNGLKIYSNQINDVFFDADNRIWIAANGISIYNPQYNTTDYLHADISSKQPIPTNSINRIYGDDSGIIWIGSFNEGVIKYVENKNKFGHYTTRNERNSLSGKNVTSFCEDKEGKIWIGTDGNGLNRFDRATGTFENFLDEYVDGLESNSILTLCSDKEGNIWMGTWQGGISKYDQKTKRFKNYSHDPNNPNSLSSNNVFKIVEDSRGNIWAGTLQNGLNLYDQKQDRFHRFTHTKDTTSIDDNIIFSIFEDSNQNLWIGHNLGADKIDLKSIDLEKDKVNPTFFHYRHPEKHRAVVFCLYEDHNGQIWMGNERSGITILDPQTKKFNRLEMKDGLPSNQITGILQDSKNNFWISTNAGLCKYNYQNKSCINYTIDDGLQAMEYNRACLKTRNGQLLFGGTNGFNIFYPDHISFNDKIPPTVLTNFKIFNRTINVSDTVNRRIVLNKSISETDTITVSYRDNFLTFEFASLDYTSPGKNQFAYFMKGVDMEWNKIGNRNEANYTNLSPGDYVFTVISSNNDGVWNEKGVSLQIKITPPFWKTTWMYSIYLIVFMGLIYLSYFILINNEKLKSQVKIERLELRKTKEINNLKLNFFTNISHEFRIPLTLLMGPLESLINAHEKDDKTKHYLLLMYRNARQLNSLISQLLDFRTLEEGKIKLNTRFDDVIELVRQTSESFNFLAEQRGINYKIELEQQSYLAWCDLDKLEKIILNLVSNAFKYTPEKGTISIAANVLEIDGTESLQILVSDNGLGIPMESMDHLFSVFHRVKDRKSFISESTGLGLSLTKSLIDVMGGHIHVKSNEGLGSEFKVLLPLHKDADQKTAIAPMEYPNIAAIVNEKQANPMGSPTAVYQVVLLIEDNQDVIDFIENELKDFYIVLKAYNGAEGLKIASEKLPDIVISDVMMPEMDGNEMCRQLKQQLATSHIPVILLTAKETDEYRIAGYSVGADDYISKPFNPNVLRSRIVNLLQNRAKLRELFNKGLSFDLATTTTNKTDSNFLQEVMKIIEENAMRSDFDIELFANELHLGRSVFFKKIKALTNQTPHQLVTGYRMKKAAHLLINDRLTISEITFQVGYTEPSNFSRAFTKHFGISPSKYSDVYSE